MTVEEKAKQLHASRWKYKGNHVDFYTESGVFRGSVRQDLFDAKSKKEDDETK